MVQMVNRGNRAVRNPPTGVNVGVHRVARADSCLPALAAPCRYSVVVE